VLRSTGLEISLETDGDLALLLGWLARLPLADVRVEQVGLRAVYERTQGISNGRSVASSWAAG
jgi:hypothetical protein